MWLLCVTTNRDLLCTIFYRYTENTLQVIKMNCLHYIVCSRISNHKLIYIINIERVIAQYLLQFSGPPWNIISCSSVLDGYCIWLSWSSEAFASDRGKYLVGNANNARMIKSISKLYEWIHFLHARSFNGYTGIGSRVTVQSRFSPHVVNCFTSVYNILCDWIYAESIRLLENRVSTVLINVRSTRLDNCMYVLPVLKRVKRRPNTTSTERVKRRPFIVEL